MILIFTNFFLKINVSINFTKFFFKVVGVQRNQPAEEVIEEVDTVDRGGNHKKIIKFYSWKIIENVF